MPPPGLAARRSSPNVVLARDVAAADMEEIARSGVPRHVRSAVARGPAARRQTSDLRTVTRDARPPEAEIVLHPSVNGGVPGRRTITITGQGAEGYAARRRRPQRPVHERPGFRPDRFAMWAVLLGVLLILVAATSSHAAMRVSHAGAHLALSAAHR
jgi:hypothetical protein